MRSRRVIVRLAPYVMTFGLLGSTLAWHSLGTQMVGEDLGTPRVVVDQVAVPTVRTDVPVEPAPRASGATRSAQATTTSFRRTVRLRRTPKLHRG